MSTTRRSLLRHAVLTGAAAAVGTAATAWAVKPEPPRNRVILGGPVFGPQDDLEKFALAHRELGYRAAYCPKATADDTDRLKAIATAFGKHQVVIAEVGRWCNLLEANEAKRASNLKLCIDGLAVAEAVGARCCVNVAGSFNPKVWSGPDPRNVTQEFFDAAVENARKIIDAVKPQRAKFCYEMMPWSLPDGADENLRMIKAVDRAGFGVHLDPCNLLNSPRKMYDNAAVLNECFDKLGGHIVSCHGKDVAWQTAKQVQIEEVVVGKGVLDFTTYLKRLAALGGVPLMLEHMKNAQEYTECREWLFALGKKIDIQF